MSGTPFLSVLGVNTHESILLVVLTLNLIHESKSKITLCKVINSLASLTPSLPDVWSTFLSLVSCSKPIIINKGLCGLSELLGDSINTLSFNGLVGVLVAIVDTN